MYVDPSASKLSRMDVERPFQAAMLAFEPACLWHWHYCLTKYPALFQTVGQILICGGLQSAFSGPPAVHVEGRTTLKPLNRCQLRAHAGWKAVIAALKGRSSVPSMGRISLDERSQPEPMTATVVNRKA